MLNRNELEKIIKDNPFKFIGLRGTDQPLEIGEILETSYRWDYEQDISSYDTDEPEELGGVCAINLTHELQWHDWIEDEEEMNEVIDYMLEEIEKANDLYRYNYNYIIISNTRNPLGYEENDDNEIILADAEVIVEIK